MWTFSTANLEVSLLCLSARSISILASTHQHWQLATDADDQHLGVSVAGQLTQSRSTVHFVQLPIKNCRALARGRVRPHFLTPEASHD